MEGRLACWDGREIALPDVTEWEFRYGRGTPCDSFLLTCLWEPQGEDPLAEAVTFTAVENGETVFTGVVDEVDLEKNKVRVTISMFGRETPVELELDQVEPVQN